MNRIYKDLKEIKNAVDCDQNKILVLEECTRNGEGDVFEEVYYSLEVCLSDIFQSLKSKTKSTFNIYLVDKNEYRKECFGNENHYVANNIAINSLINEEINLIFKDYEATKKIPSRYIETKGGLVWNLQRNNLDGRFNVIIEDYHNRFKKVFESIIPTEDAELDDIDIIIGAADMLKEIDEDDENIFNYLYDNGSWEREQIDEYLKESE
jgi:hypothetical protein